MTETVAGLTLEPLEALDRAAREFAHRVDAVGAGQLDAPTPCESWGVRDLLLHVVGGNLMSLPLLAGTTAEEAMAAAEAADLGDDPAGAVARSTSAQREAFERAGDLDALSVHHPVMDMPATQLIGFRIGDLALHAWDLARAVGADEQLDDGLVATIWAAISPLGPAIGQTGFFGDGPSGTVPDDAPLQTRLLDFTGRRP